MNNCHRRQFLQQAAAASFLGWSLCTPAESAEDSLADANGLRLAKFRFDVTPPIGHSCCGGWIKPVEAVDDPLEALGVVLLGAGKPIVLCAVDWTGLLNEAHLCWRTVLAEAAGTTPDRVAVQCVHQHNAPMACLDAESIVAAQDDLPHIVDVDFFNACLDRARDAVSKSLTQTSPVTHIATGQGLVEKVASNRRVSRDADGRVLAMRGSRCGNEQLRSLPEGTIDPWLKSVAFYNQDRKLASLHYYATHPMSYYGDGRVSSDFVGLARKRRQADQPDCLHVYFTGCAGNVAAGKYNDGSHAMRAVLTERVYQGILAAEAELKPTSIEAVSWRTAEILPPANPGLSAEDLKQQIENRNGSVVSRNLPAFKLAWLQRVEKGLPIVLSCLHVNDTRLLHLPAESFVEYQLRAQQMAPGNVVATAAYGDDGPWYIPVREEYPNGGYEVSVAFAAPQIDDVLTAGIKHLLSHP